MRNKGLIVVLFIIIALSGCQNNGSNASADMPPERRASLEAALKQWDRYISNPKSAPDYSQEVGSTQEAKPQMEYFVNKAVALEYLGRYDEALKTYEEGLAFWKRSIVAWNNMANLYEKIGDNDKAIMYFKKLITEYTAPQYYINLTKLYIKQGKTEEAKAAYLSYEKETGAQDSEYRTMFGIK
jgi:tetratricopeptide (TPR) repeat protein